ncbi:hypothetical protein C7B65_18960 [Phormidesmis priestleyi ULC007]|uniref:Outer membrane protein beta-barrel domain-containing protein n=1 Tax=Phormidesmis priestleyi ULC007 TaxID=1920490 RepID=A0A2T1DA77_9CYAN|nr:hypothetical protein [Phormidesmis priestleyi]PSB17356.1 hypothetical protein C7B65_18960 [Phormidesmis priestleyi ULC007]PZO48289.1 MAG: hypothetical protein DCF14_17335 [Phormidesmis priestleyi]
MKFNLFRFKRVFLPLSFVCLAVFAGNLKAQAEGPSSDHAPLAESSVSASIAAPSQPIMPRVVKPVPGKVAQSAIGLSSLRSPQEAKTPAQANFTESPISPGTAVAQNTSPSGTSQPDTSGTPTQTQSAPQPVQTPVQTETTPTQTTPQIQPTVPTETTPTQTTPQTTPILNQVSPGQSTRSGSSYVGIGGNIGIGSGDTSLGEGSFAVISKIGLLRSFSVRPSLLFSGDVTILLPVTYDFSFGEGPTETLGFTAAPYVGIGAAISTGDGGDVALLLTGGVDVPISSQFTATAAVNATVTGETAIGILVGVGYNFSGF